MCVHGQNGPDGLRGERFSKQWGQGHWEQIRSRRVANGVFCFERKGARGHCGVGGCPGAKVRCGPSSSARVLLGELQTSYPAGTTCLSRLSRTRENRALNSLRELGAAFQVFKRSPSPVFTVGPPVRKQVCISTCLGPGRS